MTIHIYWSMICWFLLDAQQISPDFGPKKNGVDGILASVEETWKSMWGSFIDFITGKSCRFVLFFSCFCRISLKHNYHLSLLVWLIDCWMTRNLFISCWLSIHLRICQIHQNTQLTFVKNCLSKYVHMVFCLHRRNGLGWVSYKFIFGGHYQFKFFISWCFLAWVDLKQSCLAFLFWSWSQTIRVSIHILYNYYLPSFIFRRKPITLTLAFPYLCYFFYRSKCSSFFDFGCHIQYICLIWIAMSFLLLLIFPTGIDFDTSHLY